MCTNPKLDLANINAYTKFGEILLICSQEIEQKRNSEHKSRVISGTNVQKMMCNFGEILSVCSQDIEPKRNSGVNQGP